MAEQEVLNLRSGQRIGFIFLRVMTVLNGLSQLAETLMESPQIILVVGKKA
jgi:ABC-type microcin C transport system duplicated ATPase subunit YejF